jgi:hypothetical protein
MMINPSEERLTQIAWTQIASKQLEFCTIDKDYRLTGEATQKEYPNLAAIDMSYFDTEELKFSYPSAT